MENKHLCHAVLGADKRPLEVECGLVTDSNNNFIEAHLEYPFAHELRATTSLPELDFGTQKKSSKNPKQSIFISHRSTDSVFCDMIKEFLCMTGVPNNAIFCSSLPGNDINEKISKEVKENLRKSAVNIVILSHDYYESAYCLNEAGILWYNDQIPTIPIALPEISPHNMYGFLNSEYKLRRLDNEDDISYIYDSIKSALSLQGTKISTFTVEKNKLQERYSKEISNRPHKEAAQVAPCNYEMAAMTDDECIILFYALTYKIRKINTTSLIEWLHQNEIYGVNIGNGFDLLSSLGSGVVKENYLELDVSVFRKLCSESEAILSRFEKIVSAHTQKASIHFQNLWESDKLDKMLLLFISYILDERMTTFGDRWKANGQISDIQQWESKNTLYPVVSQNYGSCLEFFIQNNFVYESEWTDYGNPRQYTLCNSLKDLLFEEPSIEKYALKLNSVKDDNIMNLPF